MLGAVGGVLVLLCGLCAIVGIFAGEEKPATLPATSPVAESPADLASSAAPAPTTPAPTTPAPTTPAAPPSPTAAPTVAMPNLVGENAAVAEDKLRALGFTKVQFGSQDKNDTLVILPANWTVAKQSTKAGRKVSPDTLIVLTCTKEG